MMWLLYIRPLILNDLYRLNEGLVTFAGLYLINGELNDYSNISHMHTFTLPLDNWPVLTLNDTIKVFIGCIS